MHYSLKLLSVESTYLYFFDYWAIKNYFSSVLIKKGSVRRMDKEDVVNIYNGILLSHRKEWNWVICRDADGHRDCHIEWSGSEREKQVSYINAYLWNLEKWCRWTGLQARNRDTDAENKCMDTKRGQQGGGGGDGINWEIGIDIYTRICIK